MIVYDFYILWMKIASQRDLSIFGVKLPLRLWSKMIKREKQMRVETVQKCVESLCQDLEMTLAMFARGGYPYKVFPKKNDGVCLSLKRVAAIGGPFGLPFPCCSSSYLEWKGMVCGPFVSLLFPGTHEYSNNENKKCGGGGKQDIVTVKNKKDIPCGRDG